MSAKEMGLFERIYNQFIDLMNEKNDKVVITQKEIEQLDYLLFHKQVICDNNGNFVCSYIDGRYNNFSDIIKNNFENKVVQAIDILTGDYIFKKRKVEGVLDEKEK